MSWGYFFELAITMPPAAWDRLRNESPASVGLSPDWSGFTDETVLHWLTLPASLSDETRFETIVDWPIFASECVRHIEHDASGAHLRLALLLDKSQLEIGASLGALFTAAARAGAEASLAIVNDGTYVGEIGWVLSAKGGRIRKEAVEDNLVYVERLGREIYGEEYDDDSAPIGAASPDDAEATAAPSEEATAVLHESGALFTAGRYVEARALIERYLEAGAELDPFMLQNYTAIVREAPGADSAIALALARVLRAFREHPDWVTRGELVENAVGLLNEHEHVVESIDIALAAIAADVEWTGPLAQGATYAAWFADDAERTERVLASLLPAIAARPEAFDVAPGVFENLAELHVRRGELDAALACVARATELAPRKRASMETSDALAPLRADPRFRDALEGRFTK